MSNPRQGATLRDPEVNQDFYSQSSDFWKDYVKGRPRVPDSFFQHVFKYHEEHNGHFNAVLDAGAGAGVHSARLAQRFRKVIVTDPSEGNVSAAKGLLQGDKFEFHQLKLEDPGDLPNEHVDMVFAAVMLHWTKLDEALAQVVRQLKPGGTFVATNFAFPRFPDDADVEKAFDAILQKMFAAMTAREQQKSANWHEIMLAHVSYDQIAYDDQLWESGVERWKINDKDNGDGGSYREMFVSPAVGKQAPHISRIGEHDKVVFRDDKEWEFEGNWEVIKSNLFTIPLDFDGPEYKPLVEKLRAELPDGKVVRGVWPVMLIMATKKQI